ncbi:MAG: PIN domain-containing protein, partial [Candidatus Geothermarchaeales archaeon]
MRGKNSTGDPPPLLDSNLLAYVFDEGNPEKREITRNLVEECWKGEREYTVSVQNLSEFYVIVTEKVENAIPKDIAERFVRLVVEFDGWRVMSLHGGTVVRAIEIRREHGAHYWDSLIAAVMEENGVRSILTENEEDFKKIPWLEVVNP